MKGRAGRSAMAAMVWIATGTAPSALLGQSMGPLELEEIQAVALPRGMEVSGIGVGGRGEIVLRGPFGVAELDLTSGSVSLVGAFESLEVSAVGVRRGEIEVLDARSKRIITVGRDGRTRGWRPVDIPGGIGAGGISACGWTVVLMGEPMSHGQGLAIESLESGWRMTDLPLIGEILLSTTPWRPEVYATEAEAPYSSVVVDCRDGSVVSMEGPNIDDLDTETWRSLTMFPVGPVALRTLASFAGDERWVTVNRSSGALLRSTHFEIPQAFVSDYCGGGVLAVRRITVVEVVLFSSRVPMQTRGAADCQVEIPGMPGTGNGIGLIRPA